MENGAEHGAENDGSNRQEVMVPTPVSTAGHGPWHPMAHQLRCPSKGSSKDGETVCLSCPRPIGGTYMNEKYPLVN